MIDRIANSDAIPALERFAQFAAQRHRLIVNNVANLDTPGYRPVDVSVADFQAELGRAVDVARTRGGGALELEDIDGITFENDRMVFEPAERADGPWAADASDRDPERVMQDLVENFMAFRTAVDLLRSRFELIQTAIRERV
jgi:flagellar basal-body rod protein FlgB